jgi:hypothetical protein
MPRKACPPTKFRVGITDSSCSKRAVWEAINPYEDSSPRVIVNTHRYIRSEFRISFFGDSLAQAGEPLVFLVKFIGMHPRINCDIPVSEKLRDSMSPDDVFAAYELTLFEFVDQIVTLPITKRARHSQTVWTVTSECCKDLSPNLETEA